MKIKKSYGRIYAVPKLTIIIVTALFIILSLGCSATKPKLETANVTINLFGSEDESIIGAVIMLANHNNKPENVYIEIAEDSSVTFLDIPYGVYSLKITHDDFSEYIYDSLEIRAIEVKYEAFLLDRTAEFTVNLSTSFGSSVGISRVTLRNPKLERFSVTTKDNTATFPNIPYDFYEIVVERLGYEIYHFLPILVESKSISYDVILSPHPLSEPASFEWYDAINQIRLGGDNQVLTIEITNSFSVILEDDYLPATFPNVSNLNLTINGNNNTISLHPDFQGSLLILGAGQNVTINDLNLVGHQNNNMPLVFYWGSAGDNTITTHFVMSGNSSISGNHVRFFDSIAESIFYRGGGIHANSTTVIMEDNSSIFGNYTLYGGGVAIRGSGNLIMRGNAKIYDNEAHRDGGGVFGSPVYMHNDASIKSNRALYGGGIFGGELVMHDRSSISENASNAYGAVSARNVTMFDYSFVSKNIAAGSAGIVISEFFFPPDDNSVTAKLVMYDQSSVYGNIAERSMGGGVTITENAELIMSGGIIYGSVESGAPSEKANFAFRPIGASILSYRNAILVYGDGSEIWLDHDDNAPIAYFRNDTIVGKE